MLGPNSIRILLIEPDATAAHLLQEALAWRSANFQIAHAGTMGGALARLGAEDCDVALVELNLPDEQGLLTLTQLQQAKPGLPIVVLTTLTDEDIAITAVQRGAQDYLIKDTVHYALVSRSIRYAIERKRIEAELAAAKEAALAVSAAKSQFLAHVSHEIRNPLAAVVSSADLLLTSQPTHDELLEAGETIRRNGLHVLQVVNDILDISKIESRSFEIERLECSPAGLVTEVIDMFESRARNKGVALTGELHPNVPAKIYSDPLRLKQILVNLVSNAVKFTGRGHIRISAQLRAPAYSGGEAPFQVAVSDTGMGMSAEQCDKLFVAYQQSESWVARQFGGTGLGLAISRELARKLGGDISVHSQRGLGSTFTVWVSTGVRGAAGALETPRLPASADHTAALLHGKILLAEDGPDNRRLLATLLRKAGASVETAEDGQQAIEMALAAQEAGEPHDLILMDMMMPRIDGFAATRHLRQAGFQRPIVALTANSACEARPECLAAGCDDFATKPLDRAALLAIARRWLPAMVVSEA